MPRGGPLSDHCKTSWRSWSEARVQKSDSNDGGKTKETLRLTRSEPDTAAYPVPRGHPARTSFSLSSFWLPRQSAQPAPEPHLAPPRLATRLTLRMHKAPCSILPLIFPRRVRCSAERFGAVAAAPMGAAKGEVRLADASPTDGAQDTAATRTPRKAAA